MSGVVSTLKPNNMTCVCGQQIDDFAFPFVAPLQADNDGIFD